MPFEKEDLEPLQIRYSEILQKDIRIDCEIGWYDIIEETLYQLFTISDELKIPLINKDHNGEMFFHFSKLPLQTEQIFATLDRARDSSHTCCEICGEEAKPVRKASNKVAIRCDEHKLV